MLTVSCDGEVMCTEAVLDMREIKGGVSQKMIFRPPANTNTNNKIKERRRPGFVLL